VIAEVALQIWKKIVVLHFTAELDKKTVTFEMKSIRMIKIWLS